MDLSELLKKLLAQAGQQGIKTTSLQMLLYKYQLPSNRWIED
jgi:hypothetical protein